MLLYLPLLECVVFFQRFGLIGLRMLWRFWLLLDLHVMCGWLVYYLGPMVGSLGSLMCHDVVIMGDCLFSRITSVFTWLSCSSYSIIRHEQVSMGS